MKVPKIKVNRQWSAARVRQVCVDNGLYTRGNNQQYEGMLDYVRDSYPDTESLYLVAMDILTHSDEQTVTNIMYLLEKGAVAMTFEIEEE